MKNVNFRPSISILDNGNKIIVTSSGPVSSLIWDITSQFTDYGIFKRTRPDKIETQLHFAVNQGYTLETLIPIIIAATYIAQVWTNTDAFWSVGIDNHIARILDTITIGLNNTHLFSSENLPEFKTDIAENMSVWVFQKANLAVSIAHTDVAFLSMNLDGSYTTHRIVETERTLAHLKLLDPSKTTIGKKAIREAISLIENYLVSLKQDHDDFYEMVRKVKQLQGDIYQAEKALKAVLEVSEVAAPGLYKIWKQFIVACSDQEAKITTVIDSFDYHKMDEAMDYIRQFSPSAK